MATQVRVHMREAPANAASAKANGDAGLEFSAKEVLSAMQPQAFAGMATAMAAEIMRFATERMSAQGDYVAAIAKCRTPQDFMVEQAGFVARTGADYAAEMQTMIKVASDGWNGAIGTTTGHAAPPAAVASPTPRSES
jgi:hypothetical protein